MMRFYLTCLTKIIAKMLFTCPWISVMLKKVVGCGLIRYNWFYDTCDTFVMLQIWKTTPQISCTGCAVRIKLSTFFLDLFIKKQNQKAQIWTNLNAALCLHCASPGSNLSKKKRKGKMADTAMFAAAEEVIDLGVHTFWADHLIKCIFSFFFTGKGTFILFSIDNSR